MGMKVYVVMSNDFPDAVFDDVGAAEAYCRQQRSTPEELAHRERYGSYRIYWRHYEFELNKGAQP